MQSLASEQYLKEEKLLLAFLYPVMWNLLLEKKKNWLRLNEKMHVAVKKI